MSTKACDTDKAAGAGRSSAPHPHKGRHLSPWQILQLYPNTWVMPLLVALLLVAGGIAGVMLAAWITGEQSLAAVREHDITNTNELASAAAASFKLQLERSLHPVYALQRFVTATPHKANLTGSFEGVASDLLAKQPQPGAVGSLLAAPLGLAGFLYPREDTPEGKSPSVLNRLSDAATSAVVKSHDLLMEVPLPLPRGARPQLLVRLPVFVEGITKPDEMFGFLGFPAGCSMQRGPARANTLPCYSPRHKRAFWGVVSGVVSPEAVAAAVPELEALLQQGFRYDISLEAVTGSWTLLQSHPPPARRQPDQLHLFIDMQHPNATSPPKERLSLRMTHDPRWSLPSPVPRWRDPAIGSITAISVVAGLAMCAALVRSYMQDPPRNPQTQGKQAAHLAHALAHGGAVTVLVSAAADEPAAPLIPQLCSMPSNSAHEF